VLEDFNRLDVLHHNAGTMMQGMEFIDGVEKTFVTNTFGPYLLTCSTLSCLIFPRGVMTDIL
jgi:NAD(P)-dependent dehydrogenase (short-subunit alcohol dehydrogenase family)